jgi:hypothetical protein
VNPSVSFSVSGKFSARMKVSVVSGGVRYYEVLNIEFA